MVDQTKADSIINNLTKGTPADSIRQLYDAFDLSLWKRKGDSGFRILDIARRSKDHATVADQLRQLATIYMSDSTIIRNLLNIAEELPEGPEKEGVRLFVKIEGVTGEATFLPPEERNKRLMKYVREDITPKNNIYEDVYDLYSTVIFLGKESKGNMYLEYITRLEKMIEQLPEESYYIKNLFYTSAAIFYTQNNYPEHGVECDRRLLNQIEKLEKRYAEEGRKYRSYDRFKYICYRRMLRNYKALTLDEVKDLYARCAYLAENDDEVRTDFNYNGRVTAYRLIAEKDYAGAIPYLKRAMAVDKDVSTHRELAGFLVEAADSVGDNATLLSALKEYNRLLVNEQKIKSEEALREMQIRYDVSSLVKEKTDLEIAKRDLEIATDGKLISIVLVSLFVLAIALMVVCRGYFRIKGDRRTLTEENARLKESLEELINNGVPTGTDDISKYNGR